MPGRWTRNVIANFAGRIWSAVMAIAFVPLYLRWLGIEAYGLIGIFATLQVFSSVLDLGLNATLNRELARYSAAAGRQGDARDLVRTLELIYWAIAVLLGVLVAASAGPLATRWFTVKAMSPATVQRTIVIMGWVLALQWPFGLYSGGLLGLQHQVLVNVIQAAISTVRSAGTVLVLWLVSPTIEAFFVWQIVSSVCGTALAAVVLWRTLRLPGHVPRFRVTSLKRVYRFSAGVAAISVVSLVLTQADKIVLSRLLPLEAFGYYSLAGVVSAGLYSFIGPIFTAMFPSFSQLVALGDEKGLARLYHQSCQIMSVAVIPAALVLAFFSKEVLLLWTRDPAAVAQTHTLVVLLVAGTALNGLMNLPYALQLAHGWTRLTFVSNIVGVLVIVPGMVAAVARFGAAGGAGMWVVLNAGYLLITLPLMHRRLLTGELARWAVQDVGRPLLASFVTVALARLSIASDMRLEPLLAALVVTSGLAVGAAAWAAPAVREWLVRAILALRPAYGR